MLEFEYQLEGVDSKCTNLHKALAYLKTPVIPPYLQAPDIPLNEFGLSKRNYYMTRNFCNVLNIKSDTFRYKIRAGFYPETQKIAGKRVKLRHYISIAESLYIMAKAKKAFDHPALLHENLSLRFKLKI